MNPAVSNIIDKEITALPVARIDAEEKHDAKSIRELLESEGCQVFINTQPALPLSYHLIFGTYEFVKRIFLNRIAGDALGLIIVTDAGKSDVRTFEKQRWKVILLDKETVRKVTLAQIFTFYFTGHTPLLDLRRHQDNDAEIPVHKEFTHQKISPFVKKVPKRTPFEYSSAENTSDGRKDDDQLSIDAQRIRQTIESIYVSGKKKKKWAFAKHIARFISPKKKRGGDDQKDPQALALRKRTRKRFIKVVLFVFVCPFVWFYTAVGLTAASLGATAYFAARGEEALTRTASRTSSMFIQQGKAALPYLSWQMRLVGFSRYVRNQERIVSLLNDLTRITEEITALQPMVQAIVRALLTNEKNMDSADTTAGITEKLRLAVSGIEGTMGHAQSELSSLLEAQVFPISLPPVITLGKTLSETLAKGNQMLHAINALLTLYPHITGMKSSQTYLVLLQNSTELRPTGGFIGSIARLTLSNGYLSDLTIEDVYSLDGQLKGHVDPPDPIRKLIGQEHWYLRDSNWDPDFQKAGAQALWFYEKESGIHADGVIGVTSDVIVDLLQVIGPVDLPDFNDRITSENFFGKSIFYTQANFFPGSTQKKDFLGNLLTALVNKISAGDEVKLASLVSTLIRALEKHDVLFYFQDPAVQNAVNQRGWGGGVPASPDCPLGTVQNCYFDPFYITEANVGVNKVNYFIERSQSVAITIHKENTVEHTITRIIRNKSAQEASGPDILSQTRSGFGTYRVYMRLLFPKDAKLRSVLLDGKDVVKKKLSTGTVSLPYTERSAHSALFQSVGIAYDVKPGDMQQVSFTYERLLPQTPGGHMPLFYVFEQKQPGVPGFPHSLTMQYPQEWGTGSLYDASFALKPIIANSGKLKYNTTLSQDRRLIVRFTRN